MKKTKMVFASMVLMIGLMATPYQSYGFEEEDEEIVPCADCGQAEPGLWDSIVAWWDAL